MYPAAFRVAGYASSTLEEMKAKLAQFPVGTAFQWCPQSFNPFDAFSPGQREEMFLDLSAFLSRHSMNLERCTSEPE